MELGTELDMGKVSEYRKQTCLLLSESKEQPIVWLTLAGSLLNDAAYDILQTMEEKVLFSSELAQLIDKHITKGGE